MSHKCVMLCSGYIHGRHACAYIHIVTGWEEGFLHVHENNLRFFCSFYAYAKSCLRYSNVAWHVQWFSFLLPICAVLAELQCLQFSSTNKRVVWCSRIQTDEREIHAETEREREWWEIGYTRWPYKDASAGVRAALAPYACRTFCAPFFLPPVFAALKVIARRHPNPPTHASGMIQT